MEPVITLQIDKNFPSEQFQTISYFNIDYQIFIKFPSNCLFFEQCRICLSIFFKVSKSFFWKFLFIKNKFIKLKYQRMSLGKKKNHFLTLKMDQLDLIFQIQILFLSVTKTFLLPTSLVNFPTVKFFFIFQQKNNSYIQIKKNTIAQFVSKNIS